MFSNSSLIVCGSSTSNIPNIVGENPILASSSFVMSTELVNPSHLCLFKFITSDLIGSIFVLCGTCVRGLQTVLSYCLPALSISAICFLICVMILLALYSMFLASMKQSIYDIGSR